MDVYDEFGRDASVLGTRLGQSVMLRIEMIDDKDMYTSIRPDICVATNLPDLTDPATRTISLIYNG
jgi:hypothetical protein